MSAIRLPITDPCTDLISKYGYSFNMNVKEHNCIQLGIGDILLYSLHVKNGIRKVPLYVNLRIVTENTNGLANPIKLDMSRKVTIQGLLISNL